MFLRKIVLALMAFLVFTLPWGRGMLDIGLGPVGLMSILGMLAFLFAILFLLFSKPKLGQASIPTNSTVLLFGLYVLLHFASVGWADRPATTLSSAIDLAQLFIFAWLLLFLRSEKGALEVLLHAFLLGCVVVVALLFSVVAESGLAGFSGRLEADNRNANGLAFLLNISIPMAFYLYTRSHQGALRWLYLAYIPVAALLVFLTASRGGALQLLFVILVLLWLSTNVEIRGKAKVSFQRGAIIFAASALMIVLLGPYLATQFQSQAERLATLANPMASGIGGRWEIWKAAADVILSNPLLGVGSGGGGFAILPYFEGDVYVFSFLDERVSLHNGYLTIATEVGIVGLILFLAIIGSLVGRVIRLPMQEKWLFLALIGASLISALSGGAIGTREFNFAVFVALTMPLAARPEGVPPYCAAPTVTRGTR